MPLARSQPSCRSTACSTALGRRRATLRWMVVAAVAACLVASVSSPSLAAGTPATPAFGPVIESLAAYDGATTCLPKTTQPGIVKLEGLLTAAFGPRTYGTWRACSGGKATSEHNEGRALDWMVNAGNATDVAAANAFAVWLFATDKYGNTYANARRLGIMYIIWHGRMWRAYNVAEGWQPYTGSEAHNDHMHISLSWAGANTTTSFWNTANSYPGGIPTPTGVPAQQLVPGRMVDNRGQQWSTSCITLGTSGGRRCIANLWEPVWVSTTAGWVSQMQWVHDSVNYLDYDGPSYWGPIPGTPGVQSWNGSTYRTSCTPDTTTGARVCHTDIYRTIVVKTGTTFSSQDVWQPYANAWLLAPPGSGTT